MERKKDYSVIIIGAGPAGVHAAKLLARKGYRPLIISENIGGSYCYSGCLISNTLLYCSATYESFLNDCNKLLKKSIIQDVEGIDVGKLRKYIDGVINKFTKYMSDEIISNNIDYMNGKARFIDAKTIEVINKNQTMTIEFDKIIIASGSIGKNFNLPNNVRLLKPDNISSLETFPKSVTVIGGVCWLRICSLVKEVGDKYNNC